MSQHNSSSHPLRLHIGGKQKKEGWKILNIQDDKDVDYVGDCKDLSQFSDGTCDEIYASHVYEHLGYDEDLPAALKEAHRVLKPGGKLKISVPDLDVLCQIFVHPKVDFKTRFLVMRMMFGGRTDAYDVHLVGLSTQILANFLNQAGFRKFTKVDEFNLFEDASKVRVGGHLISLNLVAEK